jgi:hypothetical protein
VLVANNALFAATNVTCTPSSVTTGVVPNSGTNAVQHIVFSLAPDAGQWALNFGGNQTTPNFNFNSDFNAVQAGLRALASINGANVNVTGDYSGGFYVTFVATLGAMAQPLITAPVNTLTQSSNPSAITITTTTPGAGPFAGTNAVQRLDFNFPPDSGHFQLVYNSSPSTIIPYTAAAIDVQNALNTIAGLTTTVTGNFTAGFVITYTGGSGLQPQPLLTVTNNTLAAGSAPVTITIPVCQMGIYPAQNLLTGVNADPVTVTTLVAAVDPEPNWAAAGGIVSICP